MNSTFRCDIICPMAMRLKLEKPGKTATVSGEIIHGCERMLRAYKKVI